MNPVELRRREGLRQAIGLSIAAALPLLSPASATAGGVDRPRDTRATEPPALDSQSILRWVRSSTDQRNFSGTYVITAGGSMSSARIAHVCDGRNQIERVDALDGPARQIYRLNETVHVLWTAAKEATIEQRSFYRRFPLQSAAGESPALDLYEVLDTGQERVAGQEAWVVTFRPRDTLRFAQRWWIEKKSGLLLRADTFGQQGELIESAAFSEIQINIRQSAQALIQEMNRLDGYRVHRPQNEITDLEREGWVIRTPVTGFLPVNSIRRAKMPATRPALATPAAGASSLAAPGASGAAPGVAVVPSTPGSVIQTIFSDGLAHVSVFVELALMHPQRTEKFVSAGATNAVSRRQADWWITAVGEVPTDTLKLFAVSLDRRKS